MRHHPTSGVIGSSDIFYDILCDLERKSRERINNKIQNHIAEEATMSGGYFPVYPQHDNLPDPEIRTFITTFYQTSDKKDSDELWVSFFHSDAEVTIGNDHGQSEQGKACEIIRRRANGRLMAL